MNQTLVTKSRESLVAVHNGDVLPNENIAHHHHASVECREGVSIVKWKVGQVVHFDATGNVPNANTVSVRVRQNDDLVSSPNQAQRQVIQMTFNTSNIWKEEIANHTNSVFGTSGHRANSCHGGQVV
jgi:hypothetical protein